MNVARIECVEKDSSRHLSFLACKCCLIVALVFSAAPSTAGSNTSSASLSTASASISSLYLTLPSFSNSTGMSVSLSAATDDFQNLSTARDSWFVSLIKFFRWYLILWAILAVLVIVIHRIKFISQDKKKWVHNCSILIWMFSFLLLFINSCIKSSEASQYSKLFKQMLADKPLTMKVPPVLDNSIRRAATDFAMLESLFGVELGVELDDVDRDFEQKEHWMNYSFDDNEYDECVKLSLPRGANVYEFIPKKQFLSFSHYYFACTPKSERVYCVFAVSSKLSDQDEVVQVLKMKYPNGYVVPPHTPKLVPREYAKNLIDPRTATPKVFVFAPKYKDFHRSFYLIADRVTLEDWRQKSKSLLIWLCDEELRRLAEKETQEILNEDKSKQQKAKQAELNDQMNAL